LLPVDANAARLLPTNGRVWPPFVLDNVSTFPARCRREADRRRHRLKTEGGHFPQSQQDMRARQITSECGDAWLANREASGERKHDAHQRIVYKCDPPPSPADGARQRDIVGAQGIGRCFHAIGLLDAYDSLFQLVERTGQVRCQEIRQQAESAMPLRTVPARDTRSLRIHPPIGTVPGKGAATLRVQRTTRQPGCSPCLAADIFFAGESDFKSKLHLI
jgi:hypothetical protein